MLQETSYSNVTVIDSNRLAQGNLLRMRDENTSVEDFLRLGQSIALHLLVEVAPDLPIAGETTVHTLTGCDVTGSAAGPVVVVSIDGAGRMFAEPIVEELKLDSTRAVYFGYADIKRVNEGHSSPDVREINIPIVPGAMYLICDPMLATAGTAIAVISYLVAQGVSLENIIFLCLIAAPEGLHNIFLMNLILRRIVAVAIDKKLNEKNWIIPGLGDAGDRALGVVRKKLQQLFGTSGEVPPVSTAGLSSYCVSGPPSKAYDYNFENEHR